MHMRVCYGSHVCNSPICDCVLCNGGVIWESCVAAGDVYNYSDVLAVIAMSQCHDEPAH